MRNFGKIVGYFTWIVAGILMFVFWLSALSRWLGFIGIILAFILSPGLVVFPFIYWLVEKSFPIFYFEVWGVGLVGLVLAAVCSKND